jgi:hypothetical protein
MKKILFVNHRIQSCGVYQFGKRFYNIVCNSNNLFFTYVEVASLSELNTAIRKTNPDYIIYNWHHGTMPWLSDDYIKKDTNHKHYFIFHTDVVRKNYTKYLFFGDLDLHRNLIPENKRILFPRPLLKYNGEYKNNNILTVGTFGFAFWQKGFHSLVKIINENFKSAVINIHCPTAQLADPLDEQGKAVIKECYKNNKNKNIILNIEREFLDNNDLLNFLGKNDINIFLYKDNGEGLSSALDYALSVRRPILLSDCTMFRHVLKDEVLINKTTIKKCLENGVAPLEEFYSKWNPDILKKEVEEFFLHE